MSKSTRLRRFITAAVTAVGLAVGLGQNVSQPVSTAAATTTTQLAAKNYQGQQVITINGNRPDFSAKEMKSSGAWATYGNLDRYNRATTAQAYLNAKLMPKAQREPLYIDPTGWHNKKINGGYLFNRSHLIGYQLTGQNNNPKNLITGTASLNAPGMEHYENQVAGYLRSSNRHYVRYRVQPVFRSNELLARGVHMEGQSLGSNAVHFNVYIFNVQRGVSLNYKNGESVVSKADLSAAKPAAKKTYVKKTYKKAYYKAPARKAVKKTVKRAPAKKGLSDNTTVYIVSSGHVYHLNRNCIALKRSHHVEKMTLKQARAKGHTQKCKLEH